MNEVNREINGGAVSIYGQDNFDEEFPVLKAFQQYIDAEQAKGRKRLMIMAVFFFVMMMVVVAIFVGLLVNAFHENQRVNDRLLEYAMKDRAASVVVNPNPQSDNAAVLSLTAKIDELQARIAENQKKADDAEKKRIEEKLRRAEEERKAAAAEKAAAEAAKQREETAQKAEIARLKALLALEKEKAEEEREKEERRRKQIEEYRRKYYPELYEKKPTAKATRKIQEAEAGEKDETFVAISYFDEEEDVDSPSPSVRGRTPADRARTAGPSATEKGYLIPVEKKESSTLDWDIP